MDKLLLYPLFAQVLLTFTIGFLMVKARINAVKNRQTSLNYFKHNEGKAPERMLRYGSNFQNQFELPVLFYMLITLLLVTETYHIGFLIGAWLFIFTRIVHSTIHIQTNNVLHRMRSFLLSVCILLIMWLGFIIQTLSS